MKIFIWAEFCPDHDDGLAFAIAENEEQAKDLVIREFGREPKSWEWGFLEVHEIKPIAKAVKGGM